MDVTIQINQPPLLAGEIFHVSYRQLPSGTPISIADQTNAPFVISGLDAGDYELLVIQEFSDGEEYCPEIAYPFTVTEDPPPLSQCACNPISELWVIKKCDTTSLVHLEFDGFALGVCNYEITYTGFNGSSTQTVSYTSSSLPPVIEYLLPTSIGVAPFVKIVEYCCNGAVNTCFEGNITDIRIENCDDPCETPVITDAWINYNDATDEYKICINFTSSINSQPYDVAYVQQNVTSPDFDTNVETNFGYFEYVIDPATFVGDLVYHVTVSNDCGFDLKVITIAKCNQLITYSGGEAFPYQRTVIIPVCSPISIQFNNAAVPVKFIVSVDGIDELDTGYLGSTSYQALLDAALSPDPPETITQNVGASNYNFDNPSAVSYAQISAYSPLDNSSFSFYVKCRDCPPTGDRITLIIENQTGSNVETINVHGVTTNPNDPTAGIVFNPYQQQGNTQTFYNVAGWIGSPNAGCNLHPSLVRPKLYKTEVFQNNVSIASYTFSYSAAANFHMSASCTGIVANDVIRLVISST